MEEQRGLETPLPTLPPAPTMDVESVVRRILEEQRDAETPPPPPQATPAVDVEAVARDATERVLAVLGDLRMTPTPTPTVIPTPMAISTPTRSLLPTPTATPPPTPTARPTPMATATPVRQPQPRYSRLRVAVPPLVDQYTIPYAMDQVSVNLMPIYSHLVGRNIIYDIEEPQLATGWSVKPDGRTWNFKLRENVPFYREGRPLKDYTFSAKDLFMMLDLQIGEFGTPELSTRLADSDTRYLSYFGYPDNWVANSDHDVTLNLPRVNLDVPALLSDEWPTGIMSRDHWDDVGGEEGYKVDPVGNGPWSYIYHEADDVYLHERIEAHWRVSPAFHELEILQVREPSTRLAMLIATEVHIIPLGRAHREQLESFGFMVHRSTLPGVQQSFGFVYFRENAFCSDDGSSFSPFSDGPNASRPPGLTHECGPRAPETQVAPIRDPRVRHAMNLAINRNEINQVFYHGQAEPLVDHFPYWSNDFKDKWAPFPGPTGETGDDGGWPYPGDGDSELARQLLTDAGYPNGFTVHLDCLVTHRFVPEWPEICEHVADYWARIGIDTRHDWSADFGDFRRKTRDPAHNDGNWLWSASPPYDPPCTAITYSMVWELGQAYREWEAASELFFRCAEDDNVDERREATQGFAEAWLEGHFSIPLVWVFSEAAVNPEVVQEYRVNQAHFGPIRYHEYTVPVYQ